MFLDKGGNNNGVRNKGRSEVGRGGIEGFNKGNGIIEVLVEGGSDRKKWKHQWQHKYELKQQ